jgi:putative transposase
MGRRPKGGRPLLSNLSNDQEREKKEMTHQAENSADRAIAPTLTNEAVAALLPVLTQHENPLAELLAVVLNAAMKLERQEYLRAEPHQRCAERNGRANGFKERSLTTRLGQIGVSVPQVRGGEGAFRPASLDAALLSEKALKVALAEMYVQGVATRRVKEVLETLCGFEVSSTEVSRAARSLDEVLLGWRERALGVTPFVQFDALWCKIRRGGIVADGAVLVAVGVREDGKRSVLGVSVAVGEHEIHWRTFMESLIRRGLRGVRLVTSDDHCGLRAARRAVFGGVAWQRCQFHLQQNAQSHVPRESMRKEVAAAIRGIFNAPDIDAARALLASAVERHRESAPKLSAWLESAIPEGLAVFAFSERVRRLLRTSNGLERLNLEVRRRFKVIGSFVNEASCLRLASAVLMEVSDEWESGKVYLNPAEVLEG